MPRKDMLAAGAKKATFAGGSGDNDIFRNVAPEGSRDESLPEVIAPVVPRKKFIPTKGTLLVRRAAEKAPSAILLTENMEQERPAEGTVLEVSTDSPFKRWDYVVFGKYAGAEYRLNGETLLLMSEDEIKGLLVDESQPIAADDPLRVDPPYSLPGIPRC